MNIKKLLFKVVDRQMSAMWKAPLREEIVNALLEEEFKEVVEYGEEAEARVALLEKAIFNATHPSKGPDTTDYSWCGDDGRVDHFVKVHVGEGRCMML